IARTTPATEYDQITSPGMVRRPRIADELSKPLLTTVPFSRSRPGVRRRAPHYPVGEVLVTRRGCFCRRSSRGRSERARTASARRCEQALPRGKLELRPGIEEVRVVLDARHLRGEGISPGLQKVELGGAPCQVLHPCLLGGVHRCVPTCPR